MEEDKKNKGRQKIEMKLIEDKSDRYVTFSKRRSGIYKKASELCTLCGTEVGIFFTSPSGKPFSFAQPNFESIANRFLSQNPALTDNATNQFESYRQQRIDELNPQLEEVSTLLEAEKKRRQMLDELKKSRNKKWWEAPVDELGEEQAQMLWEQLSQIQEKIINRLHQQGTEPSSSSPSTAAATVNFPIMATTSMPGSSSNHPSSNFGTSSLENMGNRDA